MEHNQTPAAVQPPSDSPLKLTHDDLRNLSDACEDAIAAWKLYKSEWVLSAAETIDGDVSLEAYTALKARLADELKHCRKVAPLEFYDAHHCYCEACIDELERLETK
jgi:hypothetical protein